jgi:DNA-binding response OmpR family regulator
LRLLVLDGSSLLRDLVARLVSGDVEIESAETFAEADRILEGRPPHAVVVNLGPSDLPWREIQRRCQSHDPPIPVLFESCVFESVEEAGLRELNGFSSFITKPYHAEELKTQIDRLLRIAGGVGGPAAPGKAGSSSH